MATRSFASRHIWRPAVRSASGTWTSCPPSLRPGLPEARPPADLRERIMEHLPTPLAASPTTSATARAAGADPAAAVSDALKAAQPVPYGSGRSQLAPLQQRQERMEPRARL